MSQLSNGPWFDSGCPDFVFLKNSKGFCHGQWISTVSRSLCSLAVEHSLSKREVVGSNPAIGFFKKRELGKRNELDKAPKNKLPP